MTILSKHVNRIEISRLANVVGVVASAALLINLVSWYSAARGFTIGFIVAKSQYSSPESGSSVILVHQGRESYAGLAEEYYFLAMLVFCVLLVIGIRRYLNVKNPLSVLFHILNVLLLVTVWLKLRWLLGLKDPALNESLDSPYNVLVRESVFYDWMSISIVTVLVAVELAMLIRLLINKQDVYDV